MAPCYAKQNPTRKVLSATPFRLTRREGGRIIRADVEFRGWVTEIVRTGALLVAAGSTAAALSAQRADVDVAATLARAGERVEEFFTRAQSLVCTETVMMQPLNSALSADGLSRTVLSELRVSWEPGLGGPATEAQTRRQVLKVNGRPPRDNDRRSCTTPEQNDTETQPLSMLLPEQRERYEFSVAGMTRVDNRSAMMIDFREVAPVSVDVREVEGLDDCISYDVTGGQRGRLWIDTNTHDVLRLDQRLTGMIELRLPPAMARRPGSSAYLTLEREDTSLRFDRLSFTQPDESLVLPVSSSSLRIVRGASRLRTFTRYSDYRRFLTSGRVVGD
jgi:hypothetical protein